MKTILTIDFDIVMAPSISLYNDKVPNLHWDTLLNDPYYQILTIDNVHYFKLTQLLLKLIKRLKSQNIHVIESHEKILDYINKKSNIINIDHHHDLGYNQNDKIDEITCANWVSKLSEKELLGRYIWINNVNSVMPDNNKELLTFTIPLQNINDLNKYEKNINELVLCLSEPWVPPYARPLFYTWLEILNSYYNTKFEIKY